MRAAPNQMRLSVMIVTRGRTIDSNDRRYPGIWGATVLLHPLLLRWGNSRRFEHRDQDAERAFHQVSSLWEASCAMLTYRDLPERAAWTRAVEQTTPWRPHCRRAQSALCSWGC